MMKFFLFVVMLLCFSEVNAYSYDGNAIWISEKTYVNYKIVNENGTFYKEGKVYRRSEDNKFVYCLEPLEIINNNFVYDIAYENYANILNISEEDWNRITLLAYYGYQYESHTELKWFTITQKLIWEIVDPSTKYIYTDGYKGEEITLFTNEIDELNSLVDRHIAGINIKDQNVLIGEEVNLYDSNEQLARYDIVEKSDNINVNGNFLSVDTSKIGEYDISFKLNSEEIPHILYFNENSQDVFRVGSYTPLEYTINFKVLGPKLKLNKYDNQNNLILDIFSFKLFDITNNQYICENEDCVYETKDGYFITDNLNYGSYRIEEIDSRVEGYLYNNEYLYFEINEEIKMSIIEVDFVNKRVLGNINISKYGEGLEYIKLDDVTFALYSNQNLSIDGVMYNKDELINTYKTKNGEINISNLPLGSYYVKELETKDNYIIDNTIYYIELEYVDQYTEFITYDLEIVNYLKKGILSINKFDALTNLVLPNTLFGIYQGDILLNELLTDDVGNITLTLPVGEYIIKELKPNDGYVHDLNEYKVIVDFNEISTLDIYNQPIIEVPNTSSNFNIIILGLLVICVKKIF